ncbi:excisionase family DNA binding protein [Actinoalloteichus hymeniacidonis]|uniref:DNA-binding protein, excisionase family n=2 Tax=Actinoalloteichus hymeniacidonis TaxID=340345 RepID=A0AAC9HNB7_9PSEU|nr:helix-turn-helix domain-containing protein [Actinoalloteichus hymeniacidonis]AOS62364.1 DNA-binding protein, excisionase family [Actinoalloteichus hymeniacidonis]MBB5909608.1 excisionase family DNA binding protein [Actinoalloteichus hymeniacidonis]
MSEELLTADEVAARLGLHVRTVRNYIRDGRLPAVRIGKQYRITGADLAEFLGTAPELRDETPPSAGERHAAVSSIVEIDAIDRAMADRITTLLSAATAHRRPGDDHLRIDTVHDARRARLKVVMLGSLTTNAHLLGLISALVEEGDE